MRAAAAILLAVVALTACKKEAESTTPVGRDFKVDKLFTHEDCTVYRFSDGGNLRYYARCGPDTSASTSWRESCGKGCTLDQTLQTQEERP